jgi:hypothetical protein
MSWLPLVLHDSHTVNLATVVLGTFAGLYGFYGLLGQPGGVLRQLLVAIPRATLYGAINFVYDSAIHLVFSNLLREIFAIPTSVLPSAYPYLIVGATVGFLQSFLSPNELRARVADVRAEVVGARSLISGVINSTRAANRPKDGPLGPPKDAPSAAPVISGVRAPSSPPSSALSDLPVRDKVLDNVLSFPIAVLYIVLAAQILLVRLHLIPGFRPSFQVVLIIAICTTVALYLPSSFSAGKGKQPFWYVAFGYVLAFFIYGLLGVDIVYIVLQAGWLPSVVAFALGFLAQVVILFLQYWADHLKRNTLQVISLVLFLLAAGLQLYQALAA